MRFEVDISGDNGNDTEDDESSSAATAAPVRSLFARDLQTIKEEGLTEIRIKCVDARKHSETAHGTPEDVCNRVVKKPRRVKKKMVIGKNSDYVVFRRRWYQQNTGFTPKGVCIEKRADRACSRISCIVSKPPHIVDYDNGVLQSWR